MIPITSHPQNVLKFTGIYVTHKLYLMLYISIVSSYDITAWSWGGSDRKEQTLSYKNQIPMKSLKF